VAVCATLALLFVSLSCGPDRPTPVRAKPGGPRRGGTEINRQRGPNVLIIITDDQRPELMAAMPQTRSWFRSGTTFKRAFAVTPLCCPSRVTIFTGRYAHNHGVKHFKPYNLDQNTTLQSYLQSAGYFTGFFGKYLNRWRVDQAPPLFDKWAAFPQSTAKTYVGERWNINGSVVSKPEYSSNLLAREAIDFLEHANATRDRRPWLMYLSTPQAHPPYTPDPKYRHADVSHHVVQLPEEVDVSDKPLHVQFPLERDNPTQAALSNRRGFCDATCGHETQVAQLRTSMSVDDLVGSTKAALKRLGETNTITVFVSDNGLMWGEHRLQGKRQPYLPSVHIPMMIRWPGHIKSRIDRRLTGTMDIAPTIMNALGLNPHDQIPMDGRDLLDRSWKRNYAFIEEWDPGVPSYTSMISNAFQYTEYRGEWKALDLLTLGSYSSHDLIREYYDLKSDPNELQNLLYKPNRGSPMAPSKRELRRLHGEIRRFRHCSGSECP
jgi:arylsulfatase A-like enzyme